MTGYHHFFESIKHIVIQQKKEWTEIILGLESRNKYEVLTPDGDLLGHVAEIGEGAWHFVKRLLFRTHRAMDIRVWDGEHQPVLIMKRPFFWFFSDIFVTDSRGESLGMVSKRFGIFFKKYDLKGRDGEVYATISAGIWKLWTFPILDAEGREVGVISKKWGGLLKEIFSDADCFHIQMPHWTAEQKAVLFSAAMTIDLDYFEDNQGRRSF